MIRRRGVTSIEYAIISLLVAVGIVGVVLTVGVNTSAIYCTVASALDSGGQACFSGTPGAGEVPFAQMAALPAGTVCTNHLVASPETYQLPPGSNTSPEPAGQQSYLRSCVEKSGAIYSVAVVSYVPSNGEFFENIYTPPNLTVSQNSTSGYSSGSGYMAFIDGHSLYGFTASSIPNNSYAYENNAALAKTGMNFAQTASYSSTPYQNQNGATLYTTSTAAGQQNAAASYIAGVNDVIGSGPAQTTGGFFASTTTQPAP